MLDITDWPVNRIATEVGIDDALYFSRRFRRIMGVSPRDYRKPEFRVGLKTNCKSLILNGAIADFGVPRIGLLHIRAKEAEQIGQCQLSGYRQTERVSGAHSKSRSR